MAERLYPRDSYLARFEAEVAQGGGPEPGRLAEALDLASSRMGGTEERR